MRDGAAELVQLVLAKLVPGAAALHQLGYIGAHGAIQVDGDVGDGPPEPKLPEVVHEQLRPLYGKAGNEQYPLLVERLLHIALQAGLNIFL
ncbi:hypothetical protein ADICEAN_00714 [Cesiribacter andamanensis AMV16]|uniref:Uncharacterized protein n=1 Tax=Cesiribacter andamanensis AMV16 TaxID=1279009 RepID=M7NA61_9BACT|nr:hypothetical protein ADICEAN_00714 [Cesiribacter andamanensis AMV16]